MRTPPPTDFDPETNVWPADELTRFKAYLATPMPAENGGALGEILLRNARRDLR